MALGIDIYRYQKVTDWQAVKRHGVKFIYVKGTDGGGPAIVRGDSQVAGAKSVDIPVGLYHYAQLTPTPEVQANVLTGEVHRLKAYGLPPALDLEDPHRPGAAATDFVHRFIAQMRRNGFRDVTLYANTSMLNGIGGRLIDDDPHVWIWQASYGSNDGRRHPTSYPGRVNIHQYTSVGAVPGISGQVDLNESLTPIPGVELSVEDDVDLSDSMKAWIWPHTDAIKDTVGSTLANTQSYAQDAVNRLARVEMKLDAQGTALSELSDDEANIIAAYRTTPTEVVMGGEQVQQLLTGFSAVTVKLIRDQAAALLASLPEAEGPPPGP